MKRTVLVVLMMVGAALGACNPGNETLEQTGTISPATPGTDTDADAVTTQTVDLGDTDRSPAEGAGATAEPPGKTTTRP